MMRPAPAIALALSLAAAPALAQDRTCTFTLECYDTDACAATEYEVTFGPLEDRFLMSSIAGERAFEALATEDGNTAYVSAATNGTVALMTLLADGTALYVEHALFSPSYSVAYRGTCTEAG